ncbi:hypothetical protein [Amycolatopsis sp. NPDC051903]|uniref:hypothetical protein n=1 Tax=Amycolatopsis sp. NPDC051903 TaxID=3363936 RepID=UPI0037B05643
MSTTSCELCSGSGVLSWEQPSADLSELRTIEMPCPNGCGDEWHHPAAERDRVIEQTDDRPTTRVRGWADESQEVGHDFITDFLRQTGHLKH